MLPQVSTVPLVGFNMPETIFKSVLAGAVQPDDAERIALFERERYPAAAQNS